MTLEHPVDAVLTNISVGYLQEQDTFISTKVFPVVPVSKQSGVYYKYNAEDWTRDEAQKRADTTESAGSGYEVGTDRYDADVYAFHKDVGSQLRANAESVINLDSDATKFVASRILLKQERVFVNDFLKTGVWGTDLTGSATGSGEGEFTQFDEATGDPISQFEELKDLISGVTGLDTNTLVLGKRVYSKLKNHPEIIDRIKYTSSEAVTQQLIARMLEIETVHVMRSVFNSAKEGQPKNLQYNFADDAWFGHVAANPGMLTPSAGYTFAWDGVSDGMGLEIGTVTIPLPLKRATRIESQSAWDNKVVAPELGVFLKGAVKAA